MPGYLVRNGFPQRSCPKKMIKICGKNRKYGCGNIYGFGQERKGAEGKPR